MSNNIKLLLPTLLDFSKLKNTDNVHIIIENTTHKFSTDAAYSGTDIRYNPIFGSKVLINNKLISSIKYGLPFIRFYQGSKPKITYENKTLFTFNIHYHGLNTIGSIDGTSMEIMFGYSTQLGSIVTFQFPEITNNQALLWYHSHNMFTSMELVYGGAFGLLQIIDKKTEWLTEQFVYGDNQILLAACDIDLTNTGTQTNVNLISDQNRSNFTIINGISTINWYSSNTVPFINSLYHKSTKNLVKIDISNLSTNWRVYHMGVCDEDNNIKSFYLVQTDSGLMNPKKLKMTFIPTASRIAIIIDLDKFKNGIAYLFFYNYDLTEIFDSTVTFPNQPNNTLITAIIPNFEKSNQTPYPTPIPDPNNLNQQQNYTNLNYPQINLIEQTTQIINDGVIKIPSKYNIKKFLKIIWNKKKCLGDKICLRKTIYKIRKTIFGSKIYNEFKNLIKKSNFEYNKNFNYLSFLNKKYYYNIPKLDINVSKRNFLLFSEDNTNAIDSGNLNGTTEYVNGANRIMVDLWNSDQLDLNYAIIEYNASPNNYKPSILPTSKFRIYKTNDEFSNTAMISNDTLVVQFFNDQINYGDFITNPLYEVIVVFPANTNLNLQEWINLINNTFTNTPIQNFNNYTCVADIITCDWSFFPYQFNYLYNKKIFIKSAIIKTINNTNYYIRLLGRWPLLQLFGKSMTGNTLDTESNNICDVKNKDQYIKCDEYNIYGIYDADIQAIFPFYATSDGNTQLPIACMKRNAELIISNNNTYIGLYDGFWNDNLNSFSVRLKSTEIWLYNNGDNADSHPFHFHMTSGYAMTNSMYNSPNLISETRPYNSFIYPRDIYQIGPQQTIGFYLTWPYYSSNEQTVSPNINGCGGMIHCHFLKHNDSNSMIIQYYIDPEFDNKDESEIFHKVNYIENNNVQPIQKSKCCISKKN